MANRGVSPVIGVILVVAVVVILVTTVSIFVFGFTGVITEPAPNVADTTGEFEPEVGYPDNQLVKITHKGGDSVPVEEIEIIVRASMTHTDDREAQLVNLPSDGLWDGSIDSDDVEGNEDLIDNFRDVENRIIIVEDSNTWEAGDTIQFRIPTSEADFREGESPEADELEVIIVHTPSNAIISEQTFTP